LHQKSLYTEGFICIHLATLGYGIGPGGEIQQLYHRLVINFISCSRFWGIYHSLLGPDRRIIPIFGYDWRDKEQDDNNFRYSLMSSRRWFFLLVAKAMYVGGVDMGRQVVEIRSLHYNPTLNPIVIVMYSVLHLVEMVVVSVNNMEDVIGDHLGW
jgi:photosystem II CP43 chlorophyll apoprotein